MSQVLSSHLPSSSFWLSVDKPRWAGRAWVCGLALLVTTGQRAPHPSHPPGVAWEEARVSYVQLHDPEHAPTVFLHRREVALAVGPVPALS